jgi:hypothetical protein
MREVSRLEKKTYRKPELVTHGDVERITQLSSLDNSDDPKGTPDSAFSELGG